MVNLPLVLPPVVTGYLLLVLFAIDGPLGEAAELGSAWDRFTWLAAALASLAVSFPLMVRAIRLAFQGVDPRLELAARSLGASRITTFATISLPLARRGLIAGWMLAFCAEPGRVRGHDHGRRQHRGPDPHHPAGDLPSPPRVPFGLCFCFFPPPPPPPAPPSAAGRTFRRAAGLPGSRGYRWPAASCGSGPRCCRRP